MPDRAVTSRQERRAQPTSKDQFDLDALERNRRIDVAGWPERAAIEHEVLDALIQRLREAERQEKRLGDEALRLWVRVEKAEARIVLMERAAADLDELWNDIWPRLTAVESNRIRDDLDQLRAAVATAPNSEVAGSNG